MRNAPAPEEERYHQGRGRCRRHQERVSGICLVGPDQEEKRRNGTGDMGHENREPPRGVGQRFLTQTEQEKEHEPEHCPCKPDRPKDGISHEGELECSDHEGAERYEKRKPAQSFATDTGYLQNAYIEVRESEQIKACGTEDRWKIIVGLDQDNSREHNLHCPDKEIEDGRGLAWDKPDKHQAINEEDGTDI